MNKDKKRISMRTIFFYLCSSVLIGGSLFFFGCDRAPSAGKQRDLVLYTSIDQPVAARIIVDFEKQSGIHVTLVTDTEATKSVGLAERLRAEKDHPQADVWWGNEPFHTINLASEGVVGASTVTHAARVRVLAVHEGCDVPIRGIEDLLNPKLKGKIAMARPTAGTTGGHVAALYVMWGDERADRYFHALHDNGVKLLGGNSAVAEAVGNGTMLAGLTDNDDVASAIENGGKIKLVIPDADSFGTLLVPTTIAIVAGSQHPDQSRSLMEYLSTRDVEQKLIDKHFAFAGECNPMSVDASAVARKLPQAVRRATSILEGRE